MAKEILVAEDDKRWQDVIRAAIESHFDDVKFRVWFVSNASDSLLWLMPWVKISPFPVQKKGLKSPQ